MEIWNVMFWNTRLVMYGMRSMYAIWNKEKQIRELKSEKVREKESLLRRKE